MGKIIFFLSLLLTVGFASEGSSEASVDLQSACLQCHQKEQIPSSLIYRRYLMHYSTSERISKAMFSYLKAPSRKNSIMPPQFFLKFPMKQKMEMDDADLKKYIDQYIDRYDVKKRLVLP
jgi:hypothetical protein